MDFSNQCCRLPRGGVDWNSLLQKYVLVATGRLPRGGVDWNLFCSVWFSFAFRRLPRGGVDWNLSVDHLRSKEIVASLAEAWIEIKRWKRMLKIDLSPPSRRRGLKFSRSLFPSRPQTVASLAEAWIEIAVQVSPCGICLVASLAEAWIEILLQLT